MCVGSERNERSESSRVTMWSKDQELILSNCSNAKGLNVCLLKSHHFFRDMMEKRNKVKLRFILIRLKFFLFFFPSLFKIKNLLFSHTVEKFFWTCWSLGQFGPDLNSATTFGWIAEMFGTNFATRRKKILHASLLHVVVISFQNDDAWCFCHIVEAERVQPNISPASQ